MLLAARMAERALGSTAPNPAVGAIIVKDGAIISRGWTQPGGRPHAEIDAIRKVKDKNKLKGAKMYVTLEPCCHHGKTKPCIDELIKYNFGRVYYAEIDKNPIVNGKSINKLKKKGIETRICKIDYKKYQINKTFFKSLILNKPFLILKIASSQDGMIFLKKNSNKWITNELSRKYVHLLRAKSDCILIGSSTVEKDNPLLNCRIDGLEKKSPDIFILDTNLNLKKNLNIHRVKNRKIFVLHNSSYYKNMKNSTNLKYLRINKKKGRLDLTVALKQISKMGYHNVFVEGGKKLNTSLIKENLVDELYWFKSDKNYGSKGIFAIESQKLNIKSIKNKFKIMDKKYFAGDILKIYKRIN